jgi:hypothetical protein
MRGQFKPVQNARMFTHTKHYSDIDWTNINAVYDAFEEQITDWYLSPMHELEKDPRAGFPRVGLGCFVIDTVSQYSLGKPRGTRDLFKELIQNEMGALNIPITPPIQTLDDKGRDLDIAGTSEAIYVGFRCGILHKAHSEIWCCVDGSLGVVSVVPDITQDDQGKNVNTVVVNPKEFGMAVDDMFKRYMAALRTGSGFNNVIATELPGKFKTSFAASYGISL